VSGGPRHWLCDLRRELQFPHPYVKYERGPSCICHNRKRHISHLGHHNKIPQVRGLNDRSVLPHGSGSWRSKIKVSAGLVSSEASLLGLMVVSALCLTWSFLYESVSQFPLLVRTPVVLVSFKLHYLFKDLVSKHSYVLRYWV
jgi:hypothetical protein